MNSRQLSYFGLVALFLTAFALTSVGCNDATTDPVQAATPQTDTESERDEPEASAAEDVESQEPETPVEADPETDAVATSTETTAPTTYLATGEVEVTNANVAAIDEVEVPSQEAGVVRAMKPAEGDAVEEGQPLALIDDDRAKIELQLAQHQRDESKEQANNDVNKKYAIAAEKVAEIKHLRAVAANEESPRTFPQLEVDELRLVHQRSKFQVDQAIMEMKIAAMALKADEARVKAAEKALARRRINAPRTGVVVELYKRAGEWVDPGDPVLKIVRSDRMRIEGYMNAREHDPHEVAGARATVTVQLARGREAKFEGRVKLPDLTIEADGKYRVWAEVENKKEGNAWILRPGQRATMTITVP